MPLSPCTVIFAFPLPFGSFSLPLRIFLRNTLPYPLRILHTGGLLFAFVLSREPADHGVCVTVNRSGCRDLCLNNVSHKGGSTSGYAAGGGIGGDRNTRRTAAGGVGGNRSPSGTAASLSNDPGRKAAGMRKGARVQGGKNSVFRTEGALLGRQIENSYTLRYHLLPEVVACS